MLGNLEELLTREPFEPFWIVMTSGDRYEVSNPHLVAVMRSQIFYAYPKSNRWVFLRLNQVAAFEATRKAA